MNAWLAAARPRTLPAAAVPVLVGAAHAWHLAHESPAHATLYGAFHVGGFAAALVGALLIQVGTNLANDYYDHRKGADTPDRAGPARASATGALPPRAVRNAAFATFGLAALVGLYLYTVAGWLVLAIGAASIASGIGYTAGRKALGYIGLGDLFVLVFFGPVAVMGTTLVTLPDGFVLDRAHIGAWLPALFLGLEVGALSTAILVVNNLRDRPTDQRVGKRTLAVRWGDKAMRIEYVTLMAFAYAMAAMSVGQHLEYRLLLPLASLPLAIPPLRRVLGDLSDRSRLNPALGQTALVLLVFGALLAVGLLL